MYHFNWTFEQSSQHKYKPNFTVNVWNIYDPVSKMYHLLEQDKSKEMLLT